MDTGKMIGMFGAFFFGAIAISTTGIIAGPPIENIMDFIVRIFPGYVGGLCFASVAPIGFGFYEAMDRGPNWAKCVFGLSLFAEIALGSLLLISYCL